MENQNPETPAKAGSSPIACSAISVSDVAILEMRRQLALMEFYNASAVREEKLGGWRSDWGAAMHEADENYQKAKTVVVNNWSPNAKVSGGGE